MKLTAEDYQRNYRALSDDEFLAIDPDDLVDVARRCYDAELKHRKLEPPGDGADEDSEAGTVREMPRIPTDEEFVRAALFTSTERAMYAQRILMDADISCELDHNPTLPGIYAQGSIGLMVPASCVEIARELLAQNLTGDNQLLVQRWLEKEWTPDDVDLKDFIVNIDDMFGDAGKVAARLTVQGIDPHTGKDVKSEGVAIVHVADGHITEHWVKLDL
jgi:hypothetical protein